MCSNAFSLLLFFFTYSIYRIDISCIFIFFFFSLLSIFFVCFRNHLQWVSSSWTDFFIFIESHEMNVYCNLLFDLCKWTQYEQFLTIFPSKINFQKIISHFAVWMMNANKNISILIHFILCIVSQLNKYLSYWNILLLKMSLSMNNVQI